MDTEHNENETETTSPLKETEPELYGKLLEASAAVRDSGGMLLVVYLCLLIFLCAAISMEWYKQVPALARFEIAGFFAYAGVVVVTFAVWMKHSGMVERHVYREHSDEIADLTRRAGISRYELLARIQDDPNVTNVSDQLKMDRWSE